MSKRFLLAAFAAVALAAFGYGGANEPLSNDARPNVVLILADDLGYSDLGAFGGEIPTPTLDRLAAEGVRFARIYNTAKCSPTRAALLTGKYPHRVGVAGTVARPDRPARPPGPNQGFLDHGADTIAELMRAHGYGAYMAGKWHVGEAPEHWPRRHGFDRYFGLISGASSYYELRTDDQRKRTMALDDAAWMPPATGPNGETQFYMSEAFTDHALAFLAAHRQKGRGDPWLLYLAYTTPHWPLHAPPEDIAPFSGRYADGWDAVREARLNRQIASGLFHKGARLAARDDGALEWTGRAQEDQWEQRMEAHAAMVARMDAEIGRVVADIDAAGELERTLIVFLSDNGASHEDITERGMHDPSSDIGAPRSYAAIREPWASAANTPFRGHKLSQYEGGIASPMIVFWPAGVTAPGRTVFEPAHVIDLLPTVLDAAGAATPGGLDGVSLRPAIQSGAAMPSRALGFEYAGAAAYREGDLKAVFDKTLGTWALYDVVGDPAEMNDLAAQRPDDLARLIGGWREWARAVGAPETLGEQTAPTTQANP